MRSVDRTDSWRRTPNDRPLNESSIGESPGRRIGFDHYVAELVIQLAPRFESGSHSRPSVEAGCLLVRHRELNSDRATLGDYSLPELLDGPIRSIIEAHTQAAAPTTINCLLIETLLTYIAVLTDAQRSDGSKTLFRLLLQTQVESTGLHMHAAGAVDGPLPSPIAHSHGVYPLHPNPPEPHDRELFSTSITTLSAAASLSARLFDSQSWSIDLHVTPVRNVESSESPVGCA